MPSERMPQREQSSVPVAAVLAWLRGDLAMQLLVGPPGQSFDPPLTETIRLEMLADDFAEMVEAGEISTTADFEHRLADELSTVGVAPGCNPDGVNDDPEKAGLVMREQAAEIARLREVVSEYAEHQSWRCAHPPHFYLAGDPPVDDCACGLRSTLRDLQINEEADCA